MPAVKMTFSEYRKWLDGYGDEVREAAIRGIRSGVKRASTVAQAEARRAIPASDNGGIGAVNTGAYVRSIKSDNVDGGGTVYTNSPYAPVIEYGRRKGAKRPPTNELAIWAQRRLGLSRDEAQDAAFAMARAIGSRGLKARHVFKKAFPKMEEAVLDEMMAEVDRWLAT